VLARTLAQTPNPVTNGGFEDWQAPTVPAEWSVLGKVSRSTDVHSGEAAVLMETTSLTVETGLNRDWQPNSGQQGTMLSQLKGGIRFWYKVPAASDDASLRVFVIPMSAKPIEDTGEPRADFTVPKAHCGDGRWHVALLAYDFGGNAEVRWVHLSPRIFGSSASLLLDDVEYLERVGPAPAIAGLRWEEDARDPGERAVLTVAVKNGGDEPLHGATVSLALPRGLRSAGEASATLPELAPDGTTAVPFTIRGRRERADRIGVAVTVPAAKGEPPAAEFRLEPKLLVVQLRPQRFILAPGEETLVEAVVRGDGTAICSGVTGTLTAGPALKVTRGPRKPVDVLPGREATVTWRVKALHQAPRCELNATLTSAGAGLGNCASSVVVGGPPQTAPDEAGAQVRGDAAWLQGGALRLVTYRSEFGFGIAEVQVKDGSWRTVARIPAAGRIVVRTAAGTPQELPLYGDAAADTGRLTLTSQAHDADGATWQASLTFALRDGDRNLGVTSTLRCDRDRQLLAFDGPMLYVGEGSFGAAKDEGLFCGLDWLDRNEESSNWQVIGRGHPHQVRYVPHPNMVTIPVMSIFREDTTVGLLWDHRQTWDGRHDRPAAAFASPDRFEGRNAHLLGLFLPSVGAEGKPWVRMNERTAAIPYDLPAGKELTLSAIVYARTGTRDALAAMDEWLSVFGVPEPSPLPRGTPEAEIAFSMRAYLESLWVPETQEWWTSRGAGKLLSPLGRPMSFVHDLLQGALVVQDPALAAACRARAKEVTALVPSAIPAYVDGGFDYGGADRWLIASSLNVPMIMAGQGPDGAWRFDADRLDRGGVFRGMDYHRLGPDNAAELGTCAANATQLLRAARMTGSTEGYQAGVKALRFMERFRVPRAAQVWEVMVQAPDVLAAAEACDAYLEAYQYDGNPEWLARARHWARGGLPFVYLWSDPERPFLLGASIPVFGASWETGSWFGRPVQWNGLRHAQAMQRLARYDQSLPWEKLARLILVSAMYQQSTDADDVALWPDSIGAIDSDKSGWIFAPLQVLETLYMAMGRPQEPETVILGTLPQRIHLNSGAAIRAAAWTADRLTAELTYPAGENGYTVLVNLARPEGVLLDGAPLAESGDLPKGATAGWQYLAPYAMCVVRTVQDGKHTLELRGARYRRSDLTPDLRKTIAFEFATGAEGWLPANAIGDLDSREGALQVPVTGGDPYLTRSAMSVDGDQVKTIVVRMLLPALAHAEYGQWYWGTKDAPGFAEARVARFEVLADGQWHEYRIPVGQDPAWRGQAITSVRLDPFQAGDPVTVEVDWIRGE
jgi:hypothetical protein